MIYSKSKAKKITLTSLKKKLWKEFAYRIKKDREVDGYVPCFTCDRPMVIGTSSCQAGHWLTKKGYPYHYFNTDNVRPQCYNCNINLSGNTEVFRRRLDQEIGEEAVNKMYLERHKPSKKTVSWYQDKISELKEKNKI